MVGSVHDRTRSVQGAADAWVHGMIGESAGVQQRATIGFAASFGLSALVLSAAGDGSPVAAMLVAASAGAVVGLGNRLWMAIAGLALIGWAASHGFAVFDPAGWATSAGLLAAAALPRGLSSPRLPVMVLAVLPLVAAVAALVAVHAGPAIAAAFVVAGAAAAGLAGLLAVRAITGAGAAGSPFDSGTAVQLSAMARYLLVGRVTGGMCHELSQSLNVITMANGNLGYIVDQADIAPHERAQLAARIERIATHSDIAARTLGLLRWFGRDGSRDHGTMSVGSALERAITVTHPVARSAGLTVELRGDALDYPALIRHGTVEMIAVAALLDLFGSLSKDEDDDGAANRVVLDASHKADDIIVTLLCEQLPRERPARTDIDRATFELASGFARQCGGAFTRVSRRNDPVQLAIRLNRAAI
jgi:signal transduction histidine kinase